MVGGCSTFQETQKVGFCGWSRTSVASGNRRTPCVCSAHFEDKSFEQNRAGGWKLKPNAILTVFPFRELAKERRPPRDRSVHVPALLSDDAAAQGS
ncbi:hypothetical protein V5799_024709 [Amblyomma americanum]|uniref:THAP-type domain-containing protein n=1 Tax=Amblyomma americanum TaxID=6943 RepID=A0AAQ4EBS7_AMBAM